MDLPERWHSHWNLYCFCCRAGSTILVAVVAYHILDFSLHSDSCLVVDFGYLWPFFPSSLSFSLPIASVEFRKDELELRASASTIPKRTKPLVPQEILSQKRIRPVFRDKKWRNTTWRLDHSKGDLPAKSSCAFFGSGSELSEGKNRLIAVEETISSSNPRIDVTFCSIHCSRTDLFTFSRLTDLPKLRGNFVFFKAFSLARESETDAVPLIVGILVSGEC